MTTNRLPKKSSIDPIAMKNIPQKQYLSFLLRLWREGGMKTWRATLENPHDGKRHGFSDLEKLYDFLEEETKVMDEKEIKNEE